MPYLTPDSPTHQVRLSMVCDNTIVPSLVGGLSSLASAYKWEEFGSLTVEETVQSILAALFTITEEYENPGFPNDLLVDIFSFYNAGGTWVRSYDVYSPTLKKNQSNSANGNWCVYSIELGSGTWTLHYRGNTGGNIGIAGISLDDVEIATFDQYSSVGVSYQEFVQSGIVVSESGTKILKITVTGKNALSTGYYLPVGSIEFIRTGE